MKDSLLNLLVFLLVFVAAVILFLGTYSVALLLVPGGRGLIFANPYAGALIPSLLCGLIAGLFRASRRPGVFTLTWAGLFVAFFLLLTIPLPWIQQMPPVRAIDASPLVPGRFLALDDGSTLISPGTAAVVIPGDQSPMKVAAVAEYDPLNQRFVLSTGDVLGLGASGPERQYFQYTATLASFQSDLLALFVALRDQWSRPLVFWAQAAVVTWFFLGLSLVFSIRTWPLVHLIAALAVARLSLVALVYAFWGIPALADLWAPGVGWLRDWAPIGTVGVAAATLFFMTLLSKPSESEPV